MGSTAILGAGVALAGIVGVAQAITYYQGAETSAEVDVLWAFVSAMSIAFWVDADSKGRLDVYRPSFDRGFLVFFFWLIYLPYYLIRTRGRMGWVWLIGLLLLVYLGPLLQLIVFAAID